MIYFTSIKQSKKLLELGLDAYTADMAYSQDIDTCIPMPVQNCAGAFPVPCWSVGALLELMPIYEIINDSDTIEIDCKGFALETEDGETLLDLVVNMVIWLLENGYIKKSNWKSKAREV